MIPDKLKNKLNSLKPIDGTERYLTDLELAELLEVTKDKISHYRKIEILPFYQVSEKLYFRLTDVEEMIDKYFVEWTNSIHCGDCLSIMKYIPEKSIDLILCDLPYGTTSCSWDAVIPFEQLWSNYKRLIKENGAIVLFGSQPFTTDLIISNREWFKYEIIWEKPNPSNPLLANKQPMKNHENICVFYQKQPTYNPQMTRRLEKDKRRQKEQTNGILKTTGQSRIIPSTDKETKMPMSVQFFNRGFDGKHPTQKPNDLLRWLIMTYTNDGEVVLDNCMGSGSTIVACIMTGRNYIGIEKEKEYFDIAEEEINKIKSKPFLSFEKT